MVNTWIEVCIENWPDYSNLDFIAFVKSAARLFDQFPIILISVTDIPLAKIAFSCFITYSIGGLSNWFLLGGALVQAIRKSFFNPVTSMLETKYVRYNATMLVTVLAMLVANIHYLFTLASGTNIQKCHQHQNSVLSTHQSSPS